MEPERPGLPRITVVTPSFNQAAYLEETIRSVLLQDYGNFQYVVMDGGSTDNSRAIIERYAEGIDYWQSKPDQGQADAINRGFRRTDGEILCWINSDDILLPGALRRAAGAFAETGADIVYGGFATLEEGAGAMKPKPLAEMPSLAGMLAAMVCPTPQPATFWRRALWERFGGCSTDLYYCMYFQFWLRALARGARIARVDGTLACARRHSGAKTWMPSKSIFEKMTVLEGVAAELDAEGNPEAARELRRAALEESWVTAWGLRYAAEHEGTAPPPWYWMSAPLRNPRVLRVMSYYAKSFRSLRKTLGRRARRLLRR